MMGQYLDLLQSLPRPKRDIAGRSAEKSKHVIEVARAYGQHYFDGHRKFGYGGYYYDGRWQPVAHAIIDHYELKPGSRVLDVGCAKGFLVADLAMGGVDAHGLDISRYAIEHRHPWVGGRLRVGSADELPYKDKSFDLVLSINTFHNLPRDRIIIALREMARVSRGSMFIQVDSYRTEEQRALFMDWVLTAEWHGYPSEWLALFAEAGYVGDYAWTIVEG